MKEVDALVIGNSRSGSSSIRGPSESNDFGLGASTTAEHPVLMNEKLGDANHDDPISEKPLSQYKPRNFSLLPHFHSELSFIIDCLKGPFAAVLDRRSAKREAKSARKEQSSMTSTMKTLVRIAATRRIVTSLGRLLGTKGDVIAQIQKRLLNGESNGSGSRSQLQDDGEIAMYMGDIQGRSLRFFVIVINAHLISDHILTLQQSLNHYERMLSHSHPNYLSQLRVEQSASKDGTDTSILLLTVVSMIVLSNQFILGKSDCSFRRISEAHFKSLSPFLRQSWQNSH